jgi:glycosyltransferase involved in cell wall biosynthesis
MRIQIITSSYPKNNKDASGTAGLFVRDFADILTKQGHFVVVQPIARKSSYSDKNKKIIIDSIPWEGGDQELASMRLNLKNIFSIFQLLIYGTSHALKANKKYKIDYVIAMWAVPSGIFSYFIKKKLGTPFDVWALGSDIWKIKRIPLLGNWLLKIIAHNANHTMADGVILANEFEKISGKKCIFLPTSRKIPLKLKEKVSRSSKKINLLFVGRYHTNKGPDILIEAINLLPKKIQKRIALNFYGLGPLKSNLEKMVDKYRLNSVITINNSINLAPLIKEFSFTHYLVIPSRIESIPVIFSDAIQSGTAVISTPVGDLKNLISKYSCGVCSDYISPESLALSIKEACQKQPHEFNPGIKNVQALFDSTQIVNKWLKLAK